MKKPASILLAALLLCSFTACAAANSSAGASSAPQSAGGQSLPASAPYTETETGRVYPSIEVFFWDKASQKATLQKGDVFSGWTVTNAETITSHSKNSNDWIVSRSILELSGSVELHGTITYWKEAKLTGSPYTYFTPDDTSKSQVFFFSPQIFLQGHEFRLEFEDNSNILAQLNPSFSLGKFANCTIIAQKYSMCYIYESDASYNHFSQAEITSVGEETELAPQS